jgi:ABC-2 type transport system ATP-binding protein
MKQIIEINGLTCHYGPLEAVRNLTLRVPEGSIYAFLGTNINYRKTVCFRK